MNWPPEDPAGPPAEDRPPRPMKGCAWIAIAAAITVLVALFMVAETIGGVLDDEPLPRPSWLNRP
ncbi:hypothetical protein AB0I28_24680 [Phytomonospora sp. NPDC050363]|uniref:hypothetical protein n=1 Tax=Phytomonospora sp. NPDC050363 TaxID=3155642 RepID=UPI0033C160C7